MKISQSHIATALQVLAVIMVIGSITVIAHVGRSLAHDSRPAGVQP